MSSLVPGRIFEVAAEAGIQVPGHGAKRPIRCPFHDDLHPSAFLSEKNIFFCSVCTPEGGWSLKRFRQEMAMNCRHGQPCAGFERRAAARVWSQALTRAHTDEPPSCDQPAYNYLYERGLGDSWDLRAYGILAKGMDLPAQGGPGAKPGFTPQDAEYVWCVARARARDDDAVEDDALVYRFLEARGLSESFEEPGYGILAPGMKLPSAVEFWPSEGYRLLAPLHDLRGLVVNVQARRIHGAGPKKVLFPAESRAKGCVFSNARGLEVLRGRDTTSDAILIAEGLTDYLALGIVVSQPLLAAPGASMLESMAGPWCVGRTVLLAPDVDEAGDQALRSTAVALFTSGAKEVFAITWPAGCKDACDALVAIGQLEMADFLDGGARRKIA